MNKRILTVLILSVILLIIGIYSFWNDHRTENLLIHNKKALGVFVSRNTTPVHGSPSINVKYKVGNVSYLLKERGSFSELKIGDTVLVEYAVKDNSVARVIDKYYMQKYKK